MAGEAHPVPFRTRKLSPRAPMVQAHPVPFRTRKLSPRAPMVLRSSPWESRTSLTNKGHFLVEGPRALFSLVVGRSNEASVTHWLRRGQVPCECLGEPCWRRVLRSLGGALGRLPCAPRPSPSCFLRGWPPVSPELSAPRTCSYGSLCHTFEDCARRIPVCVAEGAFLCVYDKLCRNRGDADSRPRGARGCV